MLDELRRSARSLAPDWMVSGLAANHKMISDFAGELHRQHILERKLTPEELFP